MDKFRKTGDCPASNDLLAFEKGEMGIAQDAYVRSHVLACEFCSAEVRFYRMYPPAEGETVTVDRIPQPLFQLAESLMHRKRDLEPLYKLIGKND